MDYRTVNEIVCSLEGGYGLFQRNVILDAQKQQVGLLTATISPLKKFEAWGMTTHHDLPVRDL